MMNEQIRNYGIRAVELAVPIAIKIQNSISSNDIITKVDASPVTVADYSVQAIISLYLKKHLGSEFKLIAEEDSDYLSSPEGKKCLNQIVLNVNEAFYNENEIYTSQDILSILTKSMDVDPLKDNFWVLDPIDGTKGFIRKQYYAIGLAYIERKRPVLGIIASPNLSFDVTNNYYPVIIDNTKPHGCIFIGQLHCGTIMKDMDTGIIRSIYCNDNKDISKCKFVTSYEQNHSNVNLLKNIQKYISNNQEVVYMDSMTKYCLIARGDVDCYFRYKSQIDWSENIWDHAAGYIIVQESGGIVKDINGLDIDFTTGAKLLKNKGIICTSNVIYSEMSKHIYYAIHNLN